MSTASQRIAAHRVSETAYDIWGATRWNVGKAIDKAVTIPLYRLTGWISEGSATTIEEDCDAAYQMGFAMGEQPFVRPTRAQVVEALQHQGLEATDEQMAALGFANYPTAVQR